MSRTPKLAIPVALLLASLVFPLVLAQETSPAGQTVSIHGIVINSITREPIGRALVSSPDNRFATMTDSLGRFEFIVPKNDVPAMGNVSAQIIASFSATRTFVTSVGVLIARKPGFLPDPNEEPRDPQISSDQEITLSLLPEALIVGRVILPSSDGATPIQLQLYKREVQEGRAHWVPAGDTTARANGEFRFADLAAGTYKLFTTELLDQDPEISVRGGQLYGYPPIYFPAAHSFAAAATIHLSAGKTFHADLTPVRQPYYRIKVPVTNAAPGVPVGVTVMAEGNRGPGFSLGYNDRDRTIEGMLPNGIYTLEASSFGPSAGTGVISISVRDGAVDGPPMMLVSNASIAVNLHWELTSPETANSAGVRSSRALYANVRLEPADDFGQARSTYVRPPTGPRNNSLVFEGVPPGRYWVRVESGMRFPAAVTSGGVDLLRHPLIVSAGGGSAPIEITMRDDGAELAVTVEGMSLLSAQGQTASDPGARNADPGPFQGFAFVYFVPLLDSTGQFLQSPVGLNGEFTFPRVAPGSYRLLAFRRQQPELEYENPEAMRAYDSRGLVVRLVAGQKEHVRLPLISSTE